MLFLLVWGQLDPIVLNQTDRGELGDIPLTVSGRRLPLVIQVAPSRVAVTAQRDDAAWLRPIQLGTRVRLPTNGSVELEGSTVDAVRAHEVDRRPVDIGPQRQRTRPTGRGVVTRRPSHSNLPVEIP